MSMITKFVEIDGHAFSLQVQVTEDAVTLSDWDCERALFTLDTAVTRSHLLGLATAWVDAHQDELANEALSHEPH